VTEEPAAAVEAQLGDDERNAAEASVTEEPAAAVEAQLSDDEQKAAAPGDKTDQKSGSAVRGRWTVIRDRIRQSQAGIRDRVRGVFGRGTSTVDKEAEMEARIREHIMRDLGMEKVQRTSAAPTVEAAPAVYTVDKEAEVEARIREHIMRDLGVEKVQTTSAAPPVEAAPAASIVDQKAQMEARIREKVLRDLAVAQAQATTAAPPVTAAPAAATVDSKEHVEALLREKVLRDLGVAKVGSETSQKQDAQTRELLDQQLQHQAPATAAPAGTETPADAAARLKAEALEELKREKHEAELKAATKLKDALKQLKDAIK